MIVVDPRGLARAREQLREIERNIELLRAEGVTVPSRMLRLRDARALAFEALCEIERAVRGPA